MSLEDRIHLIQAGDLHWPFEGGPRWKTRPNVGYVRENLVDPFPCYPHDMDLVTRLAEEVEYFWPVEVPPAWYLVEFEEPSRTNGWAFSGEHYNRPDRHDGHEADLEPVIALLGKRIPIHPAMTRYLVGHEYGHVVDYFLQRQLKLTEEKFHKEYAQMRGVENRTDYGGQRWHTNIGEIIANDFRVIITGLEKDFWPHPGVKHPLDSPIVVKFWKDRQPT